MTAVRIGLLWRAEWDPPSGPVAETCKLHGVFSAFAALGVDAEPIVYSDETADAVREHLLAFDGVLVWVNPIEHGRDRSTLDALLLEIAEAGAFVSAHPAVILRMGTKEVLVDTREMSWGTDTRIYRSVEELRDALPTRLAEAAGPLVLKQLRGMGGNGVWKVECGAGDSVVAQHAAGGAAPETMPIDTFLDRCRGAMVEQPFQPRLAEGMIRAYLTHGEVVGFTHQYPRGLMPPGPDDRPATKVFDPPADERYDELRVRLESEWVPQMQEILGIETHSLPVIWDADFLNGDDGYVLCEINVSSTFAFPEFAMPAVARATLDRVHARSAADEACRRSIRRSDAGDSLK